tara:strand:- start:173 stop:367 length:195 start_codon:yes stop_codon:yes gene_type:complete
MPKVGRAKYHSANAKRNTGTGKVVSFVNGTGRGLVLRKAIIRQVGAGTHCKGCYTSKQWLGKMF